MGYVYIVVCALLVLFTLLGAKRGFVSVVVGLLSLVIAVVGASILSAPVGELINDKLQIEDKIKAELVTMINDQIENTKDKVRENLNLKENEEVSIKDFREQIDTMSLPETVKDILKKATESEGAASIEKFSGETVGEAASELAKIVINAISFIGCFIVILVVLIVLRISLKVVTKLPILHQLNACLGAVAGLAEGLLAVWIFFAIITAMANQSFAQDALLQITESKVLTYLYTVNPLMKFM